MAYATAAAAPTLPSVTRATGPALPIVPTIKPASVQILKALIANDVRGTAVVRKGLSPWFTFARKIWAAPIS
jgi:hypothetical protein